MRRRLRFTVDLPQLCRETSLLLSQTDEGGAGVGLIDGLRVALGYIREIGAIAEENRDVPVLLCLFALGVVENPVSWAQELGAWKDEYREFAEQIGAVGKEDGK